MELLKIFIWSVFIIHVSFCTINPQVIIDVVNTFDKVSYLVLQNCWTRVEYVRFINDLRNTKRYKFLQLLENTNKKQQPIPDANNIFVVADLNCAGSEYFIKHMCENKGFRSTLRLIIIDNKKDYNTSDVLRDKINCHIPLASEVVIVQQTSNNNYDVFLIYQICRKCDFRKETYGSWNKTHGFSKLSHFNRVTALRRLNLYGHEIKVCYVLTNDDSVNHLSDGLEGHVDTLTKVNFPTMNHLFDFINASRKYIYTDTWGYRQNDTWNGMTGYFARKEIDIGGTPMFITNERLSFVEYISSPTQTNVYFVFRRPKLSYENNLYLLPFHYSLWYGLVVLLILIVFILCLVTVWEWRKMKLYRLKQSNNVGILRPNVIDVALLIFGAACQQGSTVELKGSLGRVVLLLLFLVLTFLYTSFTANIVALLQSSTSGIKNLEDLLNSRIKLGVQDTVYNRHYFSTEMEPIRKAIYEKKVMQPGLKPNFMDIEDGVKEMKKGLFAFHMETGVGYKFVAKYFEESEKCDLNEMKYLRVNYPWLAVKKYTPYLEMFKIGTKRLQEHGLQQRENHLLYEKQPQCSSHQATFVSVSMVDCYPVMLVLSFGMIIAIFLVIVENIYIKQCKRKKIPTL